MNFLLGALTSLAGRLVFQRRPKENACGPAWFGQIHRRNRRVVFGTRFWLPSRSGNRARQKSGATYQIPEKGGWRRVA